MTFRFFLSKLCFNWYLSTDCVCVCDVDFSVRRDRCEFCVPIPMLLSFRAHSWWWSPLAAAIIPSWNVVWATDKMGGWVWWLGLWMRLMMKCVCAFAYVTGGNRWICVWQESNTHFLGNLIECAIQVNIPIVMCGWLHQLLSISTRTRNLEIEFLRENVEMANETKMPMETVQGSIRNKIIIGTFAFK